MSGVLHPVGPEPEQTYWIRRALVLGSAVLLLVLLVSLVVNAMSSGSASAAPPPVLVPASASPTPAATATASPTPSATAATSSQASSKTSSKASSKASSTTPAGKTSASKPAAKKTAAKPAGPVSCAPAGLRTTLTGKQKLKVEQHAALHLSLINGTGSACVVKVTPASFRVTIYSGRDRIWSTADCATAVKPITRKVADEEAVTWSMTWNGRRSAKGCGNRPEVPRAGTYIATAKLDGAKPVTMRMILRG